MRIVAIRGSNLASLKGDFAVELDQPPLSNLGLFAIHGPVGAGKSTLLDTLTLALFGRTPRLSGSGGAPLLRGDDDVDQLRANDPATLVRRGAASAHAEVDFIGHDGRLYRARWDIRRGRGLKGRPGRLQDAKHSLKDVVNDAVLGDGNSDVRRLTEERLGLSFDELCRSVLLAQGGFQGFLLAKPGERAELLEKVTGTGVYSRLGEAAFARAREVELHLKALEAKVDGQMVLDDDARAAVEAEVVVAGSAAANADARASAQGHLLERLQATRAWQEAVVATDAAVVLAGRTSEAEFEKRTSRDAARARLDLVTPLALEHERALAAAAAPRARLIEATAAVTAREAERTGMRARHATLSQQAARARERLVGEQTTTLAERAGLARALGVADGVLGHDDALPARIDATVRALDALADASAALEGATAIAAAAAADVEGAALDVEGAEQRRRDASTAAVAALPPGVAVDEHTATVAAVARATIGLADDDIAMITAEIAVREGMVARLEAALLEQATRRALLAARAALHDDEPCPVCGSLEHPVLGHGPADNDDDDDDDAIDPVDPVDAVVRRERDQLRRLHETRAARGALIAALASRAGPTTPTPHTTRTKKSTTAAKTAVTTTTGAAMQPATLADGQALLARLDQAGPAVRAFAAADLDVGRAIAALDAARAAHAVQVTQQDRAAAALDDARRDARSLDLDVNAGGPAWRRLGATLRAGLDGWLKARARAATAAAEVARSDEIVVDTARAADAAEATAVAARAVAAERAAAVVVADDAVDDAVRALRAEGAGADVAAFVAGLRAALTTTTTAWAQADAAARAADVVVAAARQRVAERLEKLERLGGVADEATNADEVQARVDDARAEAAAARERTATARARLGHDDAARAERARLGEALQRARAEGEVWRALAQLIGSSDGSRFRQFAQGLTLDALVTHANEHLQVLAPRYRLRRTRSEQQKHDLDLVVIDTEAGGDVRSTQTLSGGESFLVSLALALGLSSLSANEGARGRVESLFIDEGFSALDQETLDVALSAFDALRQTGRQIGVISHVPLLMERLGAQVRIVPIGGGASRVEVHAS